MRLLLLALVALSASSAQAQLLLREDFAYTAGSDLTGVSTWVAHSGAASNPIKVTAANLSFSGYGTGTGNSVYVTGASGSREDVNRTFAASASGRTYAAFLARVDSAGTDGDYFFHLGPDPISTTFRGRVFIRDQGNGFQFGVSKAAGTGTGVVWAPTTYTFSNTYLVVLRYTVVAGDANDTVDLYVFQAGNNVAAEPATPNASASDVTATDIAPASVALRQGGAGGSGVAVQPYGVTFDGLRITQSFASLTTAVDADAIARNARFVLLGAQPAQEARLQLRADVSGAVQVRAYDVLGREVAVLFDGTLAAGDAQTFTLGGLPAGVYVVRALGAQVSASRTVVLR